MNRTEQPASATPVHSPFTLRLSSTPRGARLARRLSAERLDAWGIPYDRDAHDALALIVSELATNAATHGRLPGRDFRVRLLALPAPAPAPLTIRVEVTDTRGEELPTPVVTAASCPARTGGRGLLLVAALADRWGCQPRTDGPGKTVWAEYTANTAGTDHTEATVDAPATVARYRPSAMPS